MSVWTPTRLRLRRRPRRTAALEARLRRKPCPRGVQDRHGLGQLAQLTTGPLNANYGAALNLNVGQWSIDAGGVGGAGLAAIAERPVDVAAIPSPWSPATRDAEIIAGTQLATGYTIAKPSSPPRRPPAPARPRLRPEAAAARIARMRPEAG